MSDIPYWFSPPAEPSRRFLRWFAGCLLVVSAALTVGFGVSFQPGFLVAGGVFVLMSLGLVVYAWRFAPRGPGLREDEQLVRSGQDAPTTA